MVGNARHVSNCSQSWHVAAGSTGAPKGVLCCHEGLINAMDFEISMRQKCGLGKDDPVIQAMAVFADMSGERIVTKTCVSVADSLLG